MHFHAARTQPLGELEGSDSTADHHSRFAAPRLFQDQLRITHVIELEHTIKIRVVGTSGRPYVYVDGFEIRRVRNIGFQFPSGIGGRHGPTYRRLVAHGLGPSTSGSNAAFIMTTTFEGRCTGGVIQDSEFYDFQASIIKIYSQHKLLIEDNYIHDGNTGIELKDLIEQFTVRGNRFRAISIVPLGGNDIWLHVVLGVVLLGFGVSAKPTVVVDGRAVA